MAGMGVSAGTDVYFNEEAIESKAIEYYNGVQALHDYSELEKKKLLFKLIFSIYCENIERYELKNRRIEVRVSEREYQKFLGLPGDSKSEKFRKLLNKED